jgi:hypothetical protein
MKIFITHESRKEKKKYKFNVLCEEEKKSKRKTIEKTKELAIFNNTKKS